MALHAPLLSMGLQLRFTYEAHPAADV